MKTSISFEDRENISAFFENEIMTATEAAEFLNVSRPRFHDLIKKGHITPIFQNQKINLFLKQDIEDELKVLEKGRKKHRTKMRPRKNELTSDEIAV